MTSSYCHSPYSESILGWTYLERDGCEEDYGDAFYVAAGDIKFFHGIHHSQMGKVRSGKSQDHIVVYHLFLVLCCFRHELILAHVVQEGFVQVVKNQRNPRSSSLAQHSQHETDHISQKHTLPYLS